MSRKNQSIAIATAIVVCLLFAPVAAWAEPAAAGKAASADAFTMVHWLEAAWAQVLSFAQLPTKSAPAKEAKKTPPPTEKGLVIDPEG